MAERRDDRLLDASVDRLQDRYRPRPRPALAIAHGEAAEVNLGPQCSTFRTSPSTVIEIGRPPEYPSSGCMAISSFFTNGSE